MRADTFFGRIFLTLVGFVVVSLAVAAMWGEFKLRDIVERDAADRRQVACNQLAPAAAVALSGADDLSVFADRLRILGALDGLRLTLIRADGTVMADSELRGDFANHGERPEVIAAKQVGQGAARRTSSTTGRTTDYTTISLDREGVHLGTLRAATESEQVAAMVGSLRSGIVWFGLGMLLFGLVGAAGIARWLSRPLREIEHAAVRLSAGELGQAVPVEGPLEAQRLGKTLNSMSRELQTRLEEQRLARVEVETILSSMAEGVVAVDRAERVVHMNRSAAAILGLAEPLASGSRLWEQLRFPDLENALRGVLSDSRSWQGDAPAPGSAGVTLRLSVAPIAADAARHGDAPLGAVALFANVTAVRRLEQMRIDFVANVSHELRTPLAAVMGAHETLADTNDPAERARFLEIANRNAARLHAIVLDLLDLSAIESEGDRLPLEPLRVDVPLRAAASALVGEAESKGVRLELPPVPERPLIVQGHAQRLEQLFTNLLENALKYTPRGGRVGVEIRTESGTVSVSVRDTGIGIPTKDLTRIFERFYRVDHARARDMGGTGLGLAIVKHIARAHGGQVAVSSEEGAGSTFTVTLPLRSSAS